MKCLKVIDVDIQNRLSAFVQPIVNASTQNTVGVEILLRYSITNADGTNSYASPDYLLNQIRSINGYNLISTKLFHIVSDYFQSSQSPRVKMINSWSFISFNIIAFQLQSESFINEIIDFRKRMPSCIDLVLELVEGYGAELSDSIIESIERLSVHGVKFGLDDYGHESISLKYVESLRCSLLKMDKELSVIYKGALMYENTIKSLVFLTSMMNVRLIAEGVETEEQLNLLKKCGVEDIQGFYYAKPSPLATYIS
ncbi:MAG: EAL domain-containing protein [Hafnia sp.]|uniref:EAL domain-containing protein n=1 Tax=Hafnia sp. TaxID=1873498 RepID=UPI002FC88A6B